MRLQLTGANSSAINVTEAGIQRKRLCQLCIACRNAKSKCTGENSACAARCIARDLEFQYNANRHRQETQLESPNGSFAPLNESEPPLFQILDSGERKRYREKPLAKFL